MSIMDENVIWQATLDQVWDCRVRRLDARTGELSVRKDGETAILVKRVHLSYGAVFGPDVADVADWEEMAAQAVDGQ